MDFTALSLLGYTAMCLLTLLTTVLLYFLISIEMCHRKYANLPGPKRESYLFGSALAMRKVLRVGSNSDVTKKHFWEIAHDWHLQYGDTICIFFLNIAFVMTRDPEIMKHILVHSDQRKFPKGGLISFNYIFGKRFLGNGLATEKDTDAWYPRRKAMDPAFHRKQLMNSIEHINMSADGMVKTLQKYADSGESLELLPIFHKTTLDANLRVSFSVDLDHISTAFHQTVIESVDLTFESMQRISQSLLPVWLRQYSPFVWKLRSKTLKAVKNLREVGQQIVSERLTMVEKGEHVPDDILTTIVKHSVECPKDYPFEVLVDEFVTLIVAGMETSANALSSLFMELGRQPTIWKKLADEIDEVVGNKSVITYDDLSKMSYLGQVVKESLRFYPPVSAIVRVPNEDETIGSMTFPAGCNIFLNIYAANRNPQLLDNPNVFDPEHFCTSNERKVPVYANVTFSLGSRNCIGQNFAQLEMKLLTAKFIQHFSYKLDDSEKFLVGLRATMFPLSGVKCTIQHR